MFANTSVQEFFPTPIWIVDLQPAFAEAFNKRLLDEIERMTGERKPDRKSTRLNSSHT